MARMSGTEYHRERHNPIRRKSRELSGEQSGTSKPHSAGRSQGVAHSTPGASQSTLVYR